MLSFLNKYSRNYVYSQNGEEGLLEECLRRMGITSGHCVEIGSNDGLYCSNTALLLRGEMPSAPGPWSGLMVEYDFGLFEKCRTNWAANPRVTVTCSGVNESNVGAFVREDCVVFSTDTDGSDFSIFKGLQALPKIAVVEIDSSIPPDVDEFNSDGGSGYKPMVELGLSKGYFLLAHCGNLMFVAEEFRSLFPEVKGDPIKNWKSYFNTGWINPERLPAK